MAESAHDGGFAYIGVSHQHDLDDFVVVAIHFVIII